MLGLTLLTICVSLANVQGQLAEMVHESSGTAQGLLMSWKIIVSTITNKVNFTLDGPSNKYMALGFGSSTMLDLYAITVTNTGFLREDWYNSYDDCGDRGLCDLKYCNGARCLKTVSANVVAGRRKITIERPLAKQGAKDWDFAALFAAPADPCTPSPPSISGVWVVGDMDGGNSPGEHGTDICERVTPNIPDNQCFGSGGGATFVFADPNLAIDGAAESKFIPRTKLGASDIYMSVEVDKMTGLMSWSLEGPLTSYWSVAAGASMSKASGLAYTTGTAAHPCPAANPVCEYYYDGIATSNCKKHANTVWTINYKGAVGNTYVVNATRRLATGGTPVVTIAAPRHTFTFGDPTLTVIWAVPPTPASGLPMVNHGPVSTTRSVEILPFGQRLPLGVIIPPPAANISASCTSTGGGGGSNITQAANGVITVAGGKLKILFKITPDQTKVHLEMVGPADQYFSVGWNVASTSGGGAMINCDAVAYTTTFGDYYMSDYGASCCPLDGTNSWTVIFQGTQGTEVNVTAERTLNTSAATAAKNFQFDIATPDIVLVWAIGQGAGSTAMGNHGAGGDQRGRLPINFVSGVGDVASVNNANTNANTGGGAAAQSGRLVLAGGTLEVLQTLSTDKTKIQLEMIGPADRYFSVGWTSVSKIPGTMDGADAVAWTGTGTGTFGDYFMTGYSGACCPLDTGAGSNAWTLTSPISVVGGKVTVKAERPLTTSNPGKDFQFDINTPDIALVWAVGNGAGATTMSNHGSGNTKRGTVPFNFVSGGAGPALVEKSVYSTYEHSSVMFFAFGVFIPVAILLHRHQWLECLHTRAPMGQQLHRILNSLAVMMAWAALLIQFGALSGFTGSMHANIGLALVLAVTVQAIYGMAGYHGHHDFFLIHKVIGVVIAGVGLMNIYFGILAYNDAQTPIWLGFFGFWTFLLLVAVVTLEIKRSGAMMVKNSWTAFDRRADAPEEFLPENRTEGAAMASHVWNQNVQPVQSNSAIGSSSEGQILMTGMPPSVPPAVPEVSPGARNPPPPPYRP